MADIIKIQENVSMNDDILALRYTGMLIYETTINPGVNQQHKILRQVPIFQVKSSNNNQKHTQPFTGNNSQKRESAEFTGMVLRRFTDRKNTVNTKVAIGVVGRSAVCDRYESYTGCLAARTDTH
ncbi:hypothetical protein NQ317_004104 [Molorchus minor]|uniref:Uncharacterized protein n=1 Tax=Molorchus minor TaxID=1323400 RepID=A0ABQ9IZ11_9CUCU|nr:hypothetical protein NQ317_004104 [Molorchus minor]